MDMSTPIDSLDNNQPQMRDTDPNVANSILDKFNNMNISPNEGYQGDLPPLNPQIPMMEHDMENRNRNAQLEEMRYMNPVAHIEHQKQQQMIQQQMMEAQYQDSDEDDDDEEYEVIETNPMWKKVLNELRIVVFVLIMVLFIYNNHFNKFLTQIIPYLRLNSYSYDTNNLGSVFKAFIVGIFAYLLIRFVKF
jgi:hypothetical protein